MLRSMDLLLHQSKWNIDPTGEAMSLTILFISLKYSNPSFPVFNNFITPEDCNYDTIHSKENMNISTAFSYFENNSNEMCLILGKQK